MILVICKLQCSRVVIFCLYGFEEQTVVYEVSMLYSDLNMMLKIPGIPA